MTTQEFIFKAPLFCKVAGEEADAILKDLKSQHQIKIDGFNAQKGTESTYILDGRLDCRRNIEARSMFTNVAILKLFETDEPWYVSLKCGRYDDRIDIMLVTNKEKHYIMKVGQYPTIADMHKAQIKQYKSVLSEEEMKEFTRAIGLAANGVGIGSFVYLRRIFEKLIAEAYALSTKDPEILMRLANLKKIRANDENDLNCFDYKEGISKSKADDANVLAYHQKVAGVIDANVVATMATDEALWDAQKTRFVAEGIAKDEAEADKIIKYIRKQSAYVEGICSKILERVLESRDEDLEKIERGQLNPAQQAEYERIGELLCSWSCCYDPFMS